MTSKSPTDEWTVFDPESDTSRLLHEVAREARCAVICGLPAAGKSLFLRELSVIARQYQRTIHALRWDVSRQAFDRPEFLARFPEIQNATHPVLRRAAGLWVRKAVAAWFRRNSQPAHLLLIEAPLVGGRFVELAGRETDEAEESLAGEATRFLVLVPSREVRNAVELARARESSRPTHALNAKDAPPPLVNALWEDLLEAARALKILHESSHLGEYSPDIYGAVYAKVLRARHVTLVPVSQIVSLPGSAHAIAGGILDVIPSSSEVDECMSKTEAYGVEEAVRLTSRWYAR